MASTDDGRRLTEAHRLAQVEIQALFLREFLPTWQLMNWVKIDEVSRAWLAAVMPIIRKWRQESADVAESYYDRYRKVEVPRSSTVAPPVEFLHVPEVRGHREPDAPVVDLNERRRSRTRVRLPEGQDTKNWVQPKIDWSQYDDSALKALRGAGPNYLKQQAGRGETEQRAMAKGLQVVSGTGVKQVLDGGRDTILELIRSDPSVTRYIRVTDGDPCAFCAMLASRGPVYETAESGGFLAHPSCACTAEPVVVADGAWPGQAAYYKRLWRSNIENKYSGQDAIRAWRRLYTDLQRETKRQDVPAAITGQRLA